MKPTLKYEKVQKNHLFVELFSFALKIMKFILGQKIGMSQMFDEKGNLISVTLIQAEPNIVTKIRTEEKDGYWAVQLGLEAAKRPIKPVAGQFKDLKIIPKFVREFKVEDNPNFKKGDKVDVSLFEEGDKVIVTGISKGKGFAGVIKRHGFKRGPMSHGSHHHREPGSIGSMYPQHVFKGTKLPGRMGQDKTTVKNLKIMKVDQEKNLLAIKGAVPGARKSLVLIKD